MPWITEETIATQLNLPRETIKAARESLPEGDFQKNSAHAMEWRMDAAQALAARLGLSLTLPEKTPADDTELVTVTRQAANRNIIMCRRQNGQEVCVRVVDNQKYVPLGLDGTPMTFAVRPSGHGAWWRPAGREPRWRGKF